MYTILSEFLKNIWHNVCKARVAKCENFTYSLFGELLILANKLLWETSYDPYNDVLLHETGKQLGRSDCKCT